MKSNSYTLKDEPLNFDIKTSFPNEYKKKIESTIRKINDISISNIKQLESCLNEHLKKHGFISERKECQLWLQQNHKHSVDLYCKKGKIGIEVEKTEVKRVVVDFLKLMSASHLDMVEFGVIIIPKHYKRTSGKQQSNFSERAFQEIKFYVKEYFKYSKLKDVLFIVYDI